MSDPVKVTTITGTGTESGELNAHGRGLAGLWFEGTSGTTDPGQITIQGGPQGQSTFAPHGAALTGPTGVAGNLKYLELDPSRFHALQRFRVDVQTAPGSGKTLTIWPNFF